MKKIILLVAILLFYNLNLRAQVIAFITNSKVKYEYNAETKQWNKDKSEEVPVKITFLINEEGKKLSILFIEPAEGSALFKIKESEVVKETGVWMILANNIESQSDSEVIFLLDTKKINVKVVVKIDDKLVMFRHNLVKINQID